MDLDTIEKFFLWCMLINTGVYLITAVAAYLMRDFLYSVHSKMFNMDKEAVDRSSRPIWPTSSC